MSKRTRVMILKGGSPAIHCLGNLSREDDDMIDVHSETDTLYIGNFSEGFGFIDVEFNKTDCRPLTQAEIDELNTKYYSVSGQIYGKIKVDNEGYYMGGM